MITPLDSSVGRAVDCRDSGYPSVVRSIRTQEIFVTAQLDLLLVSLDEIVSIEDSAAVLLLSLRMSTSKHLSVTDCLTILLCLCLQNEVATLLRRLRSRDGESACWREDASAAFMAATKEIGSPISDYHQR